MAHLEESLIRRFTTLQTTREENRLVVRHLLAGCKPCAAKVRAAFDPEVTLEDYELALERAAAVLAAWTRPSRRQATTGDPGGFGRPRREPWQRQALKRSRISRA